MSDKDGKKRRCIVILHDDFDLPGVDGIKEAAAFAEQLQAGKRQMIEDALEAAANDPQKAAQIRGHAEGFRFLIRSISENSLK